MHKILEDLMRKRKILKEIIAGLAIIIVVTASILLYFYFSVIAH